jgi:uncharacterized protein YjbI with pentapeptide repeats
VINGEGDVNEQQNKQMEYNKNKNLLHHHKRQNFYLGLWGITLLVVLLGYVLEFAIVYRKNLVGEYWINVISTLLGAILTALVLERVISFRTARERKRELILQMGSHINSIAGEAVRLLDQKGSLQDGSLTKAYLWKANLQNTDLSHSNLRSANLTQANLQHARLMEANLQGATLFAADLQGAILMACNLQGASLLGAKLKGANLYTHSGNKLWEAKFSTETLLPNNTFWTSETDMTRFTAPNHPNFWEPDENFIFLPPRYQ